MPISLIGTPQAAGASNGTSPTLTFDVAPQEGDYVIVFGGHTEWVTAEGPITSGYNLIALVTAGSTIDFGAWYKKMGSVPDTSVQCRGTGISQHGCAYASYVFRGVHGTTPLDVTATKAGPTANGQPDCPSIDPVTNDCLILALIGKRVNDGAVNGPSGYINAITTVGGDSVSFTIHGSTKQLSGHAAEDPGIGSNWLEASQYWGAITIALRPAPPDLTHSVDTLLKESTDIIQTTDTALKRSVDVLYSSDSLVKQTFNDTHTTDSHLIAALGLSHSCDVILKKTTDIVHDIDTLIRKSTSFTHATDSILNKLLNIAHETDTLVSDIQSDIKYATEILTELLFKPTKYLSITNLGERQAIEITLMHGQTHILIINSGQAFNFHANELITSFKVRSTSNIPIPFFLLIDVYIDTGIEFTIYDSIIIRHDTSTVTTDIPNFTTPPPTQLPNYILHPITDIPNFTTPLPTPLPNYISHSMSNMPPFIKRPIVLFPKYTYRPPMGS